MDLTKENKLIFIIPKQCELFDSKYVQDKVPTMIKGIYCLYDENKKLIYIGKSVNCIRQRLITHLISNPSKYLTDWNLECMLELRSKSKYISFCFIKEKELIGCIEELLIIKCNPILNRKKMYNEINKTNGR